MANILLKKARRLIVHPLVIRFVTVYVTLVILPLVIGACNWSGNSCYAFSCTLWWTVLLSVIVTVLATLFHTLLLLALVTIVSLQYCGVSGDDIVLKIVALGQYYMCTILLV
jgi:hypothetical protein